MMHYARIMAVIVLNLCITSGNPLQFPNNSEILIEGRSGTCPYKGFFNSEIRIPNSEFLIEGRACPYE
jgi:hypothetical protein